VKQYDLGNAFPAMPERFEVKIRRTILEMERSKMKRNATFKVALLVATLLITLLSMNHLPALLDKVGDITGDEYQALSTNAQRPSYQTEKFMLTVEKCTSDDTGLSFAWKFENTHDSDTFFLQCTISLSGRRGQKSGFPSSLSRLNCCQPGDESYIKEWHILEPPLRDNEHIDATFSFEVYKSTVELFISEMPVINTQAEWDAAIGSYFEEMPDGMLLVMGSQLIVPQSLQNEEGCDVDKMLAAGLLERVDHFEMQVPISVSGDNLPAIQDNINDGGEEDILASIIARLQPSYQTDDFILYVNGYTSDGTYITIDWIIENCGDDALFFDYSLSLDCGHNTDLRWGLPERNYQPAGESIYRSVKWAIDPWVQEGEPVIATIAFDVYRNDERVDQFEIQIPIGVAGDVKSALTDGRPLEKEMDGYTIRVTRADKYLNAAFVDLEYVFETKQDMQNMASSRVGWLYDDEQDNLFGRFGCYPGTHQELEDRVRAAEQDRGPTTYILTDYHYESTDTYQREDSKWVVTMHRALLTPLDDYDALAIVPIGFSIKPNKNTSYIKATCVDYWEDGITLDFSQQSLISTPQLSYETDDFILTVDGFRSDGEYYSMDWTFNKLHEEDALFSQFEMIVSGEKITGTPWGWSTIYYHGRAGETGHSVSGKPWYPFSAEKQLAVKIVFNVYRSKVDLLVPEWHADQSEFTPEILDGRLLVLGNSLVVPESFQGEGIRAVDEMIAAGLLERVGHYEISVPVTMEAKAKSALIDGQPIEKQMDGYTIRVTRADQHFNGCYINLEYVFDTEQDMLDLAKSRAGWLQEKDGQEILQGTINYYQGTREEMERVLPYAPYRSINDTPILQYPLRYSLLTGDAYRSGRDKWVVSVGFNYPIIPKTQVITILPVGYEPVSDTLFKTIIYWEDAITLEFNP